MAKDSEIVEEIRRLCSLYAEKMILQLENPAPREIVLEEEIVAPRARKFKDGFKEINQVFDAFGDALLEGMEASIRRKDTGYPIITSYRINPSEPDNDTFTMDIKWRFLWTNHPSRRITLPFLKKFALPEGYRPEARADAAALIPNPEYFGRETVQWLASFFSEDVKSLLERAEKTEGIYDKEAIYKDAYRMAKNDQQRVLVLEHLINALNEYQKYINERHQHDRNIQVLDKILNKNLSISHVPNID